MRKTLNLPSYQMPTIELRDHLIDKLSVLFNKCGSNIKEYNLPQKTNSTGSIHDNRFIEEELSYNFDTLSQTAYNLRVKLNDQQLHAFNTIVDTVLSNIFGFFFFIWIWRHRKDFPLECDHNILTSTKKDSLNGCIFWGCLLAPSRWSHNTFKVQNTLRTRRNINLRH